jgi:hypothetical protein
MTFNPLSIDSSRSLYSSFHEAIVPYFQNRLIAMTTFIALNVLLFKVGRTVAYGIYKGLRDRYYAYSMHKIVPMAVFLGLVGGGTTLYAKSMRPPFHTLTLVATSLVGNYARLCLQEANLLNFQGIINCIRHLRSKASGR